MCAAAPAAGGWPGHAMHFSPYKNGIMRESGQGIGIGLGCLLLHPI